MDKLLRFVDVEARDQYMTALPKDVFDPVAAFPEWATRTSLRAAQETMEKEREASQAPGTRTAIEFVASSGSA